MNLDDVFALMQLGQIDEEDLVKAVATIKTGACFSCSQVSIEPKTRMLRPSPSLAKPFSISSIHRTQGAIASEVASASRSDSSGARRPSKMRPRSRRSSGRPQCRAMTLAVRLLPQPWTPTKSSPLGEGALALMEPRLKLL